MMYFSIMYLKALFSGKCRVATFMFTKKWLGSQMNKHVLLQVGLLGKLLIALSAGIFLMFLMNLPDMTVQGIFGTEDEFTFYAMQLPGPFMDLLNVLPQSFWI